MFYDEAKKTRARAGTDEKIAMQPHAAFHGLLCVIGVLSLAGCDARQSTQTIESPRVEESRPAGPASLDSAKARQVAFLNRLREADPQYRTIDRALLNEQNELGLVLSRSVEMDKISSLMRTMLTQMAKEFPGDDLTVIAYAPSVPPRKIGTARLSARTRDMTYTPEG